MLFLCGYARCKWQFMMSPHCEPKQIQSWSQLTVTVTRVSCFASLIVRGFNDSSSGRKVVPEATDNEEFVFMKQLIYKQNWSMMMHSLPSWHQLWKSYVPIWLLCSQKNRQLKYTKRIGYEILIYMITVSSPLNIKIRCESH